MGGGVDPDDPPPAKPKTRYYGTKRVDPLRSKPAFEEITDEIIQQLAALPGAHVKITVEIESVLSAGFDDATVRTISENSHTLQFDEHGFEE